MTPPRPLVSITAQRLLAHMPVAVGIFSPDGILLASSDRAARIRGSRDDDLVGRHIAELAPGTGPMIARVIAEMCETGVAPADEIIDWPIGDGVAERWRYTFFPIRDDDGAIVAVGLAAAEETEEERRRTRLQSFEAIVEQSSNLVAMATLQNHLIYMNRAGRALLGHGENDPLLGSAGAYVEGGVPAGWQSDAPEGWRGQVELRHVQTGSPVPLEGVAFVVRSDDDTPIFRGIVLRDVRDRERLLRRLELQVQRMPVPVVTVAAGARVIRWNPAAQRLFGYTERDAVGRRVDELLAAPRLAAILAPDGPHEDVIESVAADGEQHVVEWVAVALADVTDDGEETMLIGRDLTAQQRAEDDRRDALRIASMATWSANLQTMRVEGSEGLHELLGLPPGTDLTVADCVRLLDPSERRRLSQLRRGRPNRSLFQHRIRLADGAGGWRWLALSGRTVGSRAHGNLRDVTVEHRALLRTRELDEQRRKLLERMLLTEEEERGRIAGALHDDTVQLMAALQLNLDRIGVALGGQAPTATSLLAETRSALTDALDRTRHLMFELRPQRFDHHGLRFAISTLCDEVALETGITTTVDVTPERFDGMVEELCYRTVREAVVNARKHSGAEHLWVRVHAVGGSVQGAVRDDGRGFDVDRLSHMRMRVHMGLDAMAERLRMADGHCDVRSAPGEGCAVMFSIPLAAERNEVVR